MYAHEYASTPYMININPHYSGTDSLTILPFSTLTDKYLLSLNISSLTLSSTSIVHTLYTIELHGNDILVIHYHMGLFHMGLLT